MSAVGGHFPGLPRTPGPVGASAPVPDRMQRAPPDRDRHLRPRQPRQATGKHWGRTREYPEPRVGMRFGSWRVTEILGRGYQGRADLRIELRCEHGMVRQMFEFLARKLGKCPHELRRP